MFVKSRLNYFLLSIFSIRYVPDDTSFEDDPIHDEATEATVAAAGAAYQGVEFVTDVSVLNLLQRFRTNQNCISSQALRHSKVKLTWDADDPHRKNKISSYLANATDSKGKGKGKGAQDLNDDDIKAYLASSSDESAESEEDDFFEVEEGSKEAKKGKRETLRGIFGLDKAGGAKLKDWDGGKNSNKGGGIGGDGEMQITFAPALTDAKNRADAQEAEDSKDETAIETYKRKEKERRERKKAERKAKRAGITLAPEGEEGPEFGGQDDGPGGFDDAFFNEDADEAFAAFDAGDDLMSDEDGNKKNKGKEGKEGKLSKKAKRALKEKEERDNIEAQASLALLVASDDEDANREGGKHFDMRAILKAEKNAGKRRGGKGRGKKPEAGAEAKKDDFEIDVGDARFKSLHEDYDFAIDPTDSRYDLFSLVFGGNRGSDPLSSLNCRFQKTRNMTTLLAEGRKRREKNHDPRAPVGAISATTPKIVKPVDEGADLKKLVESVKRKAGEVGGRGKRSKAE